MLALEGRIRLVDRLTGELADKPFAEAGEVLGVPPAELACETGSLEPFDGVLANRLEHPVAPIVRSPDETAVAEPRQRFALPADDLDGVGREAARERAEAREQRLLDRAQQVVAPADRRAQRSLPLRDVAGTSRADLEAAVERGEQLVGRQLSGSSGDELDRQRQAVEALADLRGEAGIRLAVGSPCTNDVQLLGLLRGERRHGSLVLAVHAQRRSARREHPHARRRLEDLGDKGRGLEHLLEVVEQEQQLAGVQLVEQ